ncbi:MAG TPA: VanZ family protein [Nannocystaceae bacterium]|nr:VanZ family protein [Nannocystaceae bacterium]
MRRWALLVGYVALLYASLPWTRDVLVALYQLELVGALVTVSYFAAAVLLAWYVVFDVRLTDKAAFVALVVLGGVVGALVLGLAIPEERLHFLQYGVLAVLARRALAERFAPAWQYALAIAIAGAVGWGDELIQGRLPGRVYDLRDVLNNALAAVFAMAGAEALHNRLGWRSAEAKP